jgi:hypothetical protein
MFSNSQGGLVSTVHELLIETLEYLEELQGRKEIERNG